MISLWPAIDLMGGGAVRLLHGDPSRKTVFPERPVDVAVRFAAEGADGIHVVDLDAAFGTGSNAAAVRDIVEASPVPVELGGGLRDREAVEAALRHGAARVVLGSLPFRAPEIFAGLLRDLGPRLVVALDTLDLAARRGDRLRGHARGTLLGQPATLTIRGGTVPDMLRERVLPLELDLALARARLRVEGALALAESTRDTALRFDFRADRAGDLHWLGVPPQATLPVALRGPNEYSQNRTLPPRLTAA